MKCKQVFKFVSDIDTRHIRMRYLIFISTAFWICDAISLFLNCSTFYNFFYRSYILKLIMKYFDVVSNLGIVPSLCKNIILKIMIVDVFNLLKISRTFNYFFLFPLVSFENILILRISPMQWSWFFHKNTCIVLFLSLSQQ